MPESKPTSSKLAASIEKVKAVQPTRQRASKKAPSNAKPKAPTQAKVTRRTTAQKPKSDIQSASPMRRSRVWPD
jgi:hypothetical protein